MIDLLTRHRIHVVGVGGSGMSAIATVLAQMGHVVSGSDLRDGVHLDRLRALGVAVSVGSRAEHVPEGTDLVAVSTAVPPTDREVRAAVARGVPVLRRAEILAAIAATRSTVAVAGTHGKTTTSSMLAMVLVEADLEPGFVIGADVNEIGAGALWGSGDWLVVEADESDGTFLELPRNLALVTNVEPDHLEHYGGVAGVEAAFERFVADTAGPVVVCADDPVAARIGGAYGATTYGTSEEADWWMAEVRVDALGSSFTLVRDGEPVCDVRLPVAGLHNARNAAAAAVASILVGARPEAVRRALARFAGVVRRFEHRGEAAGVAFVDDYAHLPTEVAAAVAAARTGSPARVVAVFQPHRYSRTAGLWRDFADSFTGADLVVLTDVYPAGEQPRPGVSGKLIVDAVLGAHPHARVAYLPRRSELVSYLRGALRPGDLCLTLGAGDITSVPDELLEHTR